MRTLKRLLLALTATVLGTWGLAMIWAYWPGEPEVPVENLLSADDRLLNVAGLRLRYREWGEPTREQPSLLLLHGFANLRHDWPIATMSLPSTCQAMVSRISPSITIITTDPKPTP
jgi:hypothetical protein